MSRIQKIQILSFLFLFFIVLNILLPLPLPPLNIFQKEWNLLFHLRSPGGNEEKHPITSASYLRAPMLSWDQCSQSSPGTWDAWLIWQMQWLVLFLQPVYWESSLSYSFSSFHTHKLPMRLQYFKTFWWCSWFFCVFFLMYIIHISLF